MTLIDRITHNPNVMGGKACMRGMRVTVSMLLGLLASGESRQSILASYSCLENEDIDAVLAYEKSSGPVIDSTE